MARVVVVTGGAGFIGSHLVARLLEQGETVRVLERPGADVSHLPLDRIDVARADITDRSAVRQALRGAERVNHLAADPNLWALRRGRFHRVNFLGTVNVLEEALAAGARRIVHTSTESILTRQHQDGPITESQRVSSRDQLGPYCLSKFRAERHAWELARAGAPIVVVNPTLPVGPGDRGRSPPTRMMLDFCLGRSPAYLDAQLNMIDVRDLALAMTRAMDRGIVGRRYLLGHEDWSIRGVFAFLASQSQQPEPRWRVPYPLALTVAWVNELMAVWSGGRQPPMATLTGVRLAGRVMRFDARSSLAELQVEPRPVAQALAEAVAWFRAVGWLPDVGGELGT